MSAPDKNHGEGAGSNRKAAIAAAGAVLFLVSILLGLPAFWLGVVLAAGLTVGSTLLGMRIGLVLLAVSALGLAILPALLGRPVDIVSLLGLSLVLPAMYAGSALARRTAAAELRRAEEALERTSLQIQLTEVLEVIRNLAQSDNPTELFEETVRYAIRLIPGAEAGSLMLFDRGEFRFVAAEGYDRTGLEKISGVGYITQLEWYARPEDEFQQGVPRLLTGEQISDASFAALENDEQRRTMAHAGRVRELQANICVPICYGGAVLGLLNVDSFAETNPFGQHALLLAETFAQQTAVIIRQTLYRDALERAVVTDPLTGLGNREGFNRQLNVELARARRYGQVFNLVMIDLDGFKRINDHLGHPAGDRALVRVAEAMELERREGDSAFRWGGDEFALILPQIGRQEAWLVAERHATAISRIEVEEFGLAASFGIASYPEDGMDAESLLRKADDLMFRYKSA